MSSLRQFAGLRSALRAVTIARPTASLRVTAVSRVAARGFAPIATRAFSASVIARSDAASGVPSPLAAKLADEISYEQEENVPEQTPEFLKAFKEQGVWAIEENTGSDEVTLTRKFGNEQIKIVFSISDVDQSNEDEFPQEDEQGEVEEDQAYSYPIRTSITITKTTSNGALVIDALAQDGAFLCDSIAYYSDAATAQSNGAEADWTRRGLYFGPQFEQLDVAVQEEFERYLNERGIDESLALFIPDFAEYKEQKEYLKWLNGVHDFIKA